MIRHTGCGERRGIHYYGNGLGFYCSAVFQVVPAHPRGKGIFKAVRTEKNTHFIRPTEVKFAEKRVRFH
jgi:hypothetical protein